MKNLLLFVAIVLGFIVLMPLSVRIAEVKVFTRPFNGTLYSPVLQVCSDHVEILFWQDLAEPRGPAPRKGCTFEIAPETQAWVEQAVRNTQSPVPQKSAWTLRVKQLTGGGQRVELELLGDGIAGMIYEVRDGKISPLQSLLTGPGGGVIFGFIDLLLNVLLWSVVSVGVRIAMRIHSARAGI